MVSLFGGDDVVLVAVAVAVAAALVLDVAPAGGAGAGTDDAVNMGSGYAAVAEDEGLSHVSCIYCCYS